jgi:hypothetical protein
VRDDDVSGAAELESGDLERLDERVGEPLLDGRDDSDSMLPDAASEADERRDAATLRSSDPAIDRL